MTTDAETIEQLIAGFPRWVSQQPAGASYEYCAPKGCAFAQYLRACGYPEAHVNPLAFGLTEAPSTIPLPMYIDTALQGDDEVDWTFGALANRLSQAELEGLVAK